MDTNRTCRSCQKPIGPGTPLGLCPQCLILSGFPSGVETEGEPSGRHAFVPPTIESLASLFPQLEILQLLGKGGMGVVYQARQKQLNRLVALKILPPDIGAEPGFAERFTREAQALAQLNHPGIVTLYEFGQAGGMPFFLMEFVDGINLAQALAKGRLSPREALSIVPQICDALQFAHDQGIIHRDIKPENILLDRRGRVKVADFGLAMLAGGSAETGADAGGAGDSSQLTEAGKVVGTPRYMSPEQLERPGQVDQRADIYALGVVFYQMLTGELPGKPIEPPSKRVQIDVRLDEVVLHALEKDPARRYAQASQLKTQIEAIAGAPVPGDAAELRRGAAVRFSRTALAGAVWLLCCVAAVAYVAECGLPLSGGRNFPGELGTTLGQLLLAIGLSGSFGATVLGWLATAEIRRSAGQLRGLGLAVFDGWFFPVLALDAALLRCGLYSAFGAVPGVLVMLVVDALLIWLLWRALRKSPVSQPPGAVRAPSLVYRVMRAGAFGSLGLGALGMAALTLFWCSRLTDNIALPFVNDPPALGRWTSVDFVDSPEQFQPGAQCSKGDLFFKGLVLLSGGRSASRWYTWTKGVIICKADKTAASYELREIAGKRFMFMEWKSGDYIFTRHKPKYYVLQWQDGASNQPEK